jgi:hypothetical protein
MTKKSKEKIQNDKRPLKKHKKQKPLKKQTKDTKKHVCDMMETPHLLTLKM